MQAWTDLTETLAPFPRSNVLLREGYLVDLFEKTADVPPAPLEQDGLRQTRFQRAALRMLGGC